MAICDFRLATLPVRYSYGKKSINQASISIGYSYGSRCYTQITDPQVGFKAAATQAILNNLPPWMIMRKQEDTTGWRLVNSYGMAVENTLDLINKQLKNLFLTTTDRFMRHRVYRGDIATEEIFEFTPSRNLLTNSSFSKADVARTNLPQDWTDYNKPATQSVFLDRNTVLKGTNSVRMDNPGTLGQLVDISGLGAIDTLTASVYIYSNSQVNISLVLSVQDLNTGIASNEATLKVVPTRWQRLEVTVPVSKEGFEAQVIIRSNSAVTVHFDCVQLELASSASDWQASDLDKLVYIDSTIPIRFVEARSNSDSITIYPISTSSGFSQALIPTRISRALPRPIDLEPFSSGSFGRRVDFFNTVTSITWYIESAQVVASDSDNRFDIKERYDIRDLRFFQGLGYGTVADCNASIVPLAVAIRDDLLFVACKETFRGNTIRTLKVIYPRKPPTDQTYLESFVDFELDLNFGTTFGSEELDEEVSSIGFSERDPSWMVVNTNLGRTLYFRIWFDYFYINFSNRLIYTIEKYDNAQLQIA